MMTVLGAAFFIAALLLWGSVEGKTREYPDLEDKSPDNAIPLRANLNCSRLTEVHIFALLNNGSLWLPSSRQVYEHETFFVQNDTAYLCSKNDSDSDYESESTEDFHGNILHCPQFLLDPDEYQLLSNGSVYVQAYDMFFGPSNYYLSEEGLYVCHPPFDDMAANHTQDEPHTLNKFSESFTYVTYVGLLLSIGCLVAHLCVFCLVPSVRNLPGCCLASLSVSLLVAYCCFMAVSFATTTETCSALGLCIYYFFLSSFFWMNAIAFDVWRSFRVVMKELRISSHKVPWRRFLFYSSYSWLIPAILATLVKVFDSTDLLPEDLRPSFGDEHCWFGKRKSLIIFFAIPLVVVMLLNAVFFLDVTILINRHTLKTSQSHEVTMKKRFFMFMRLALIMGLTWIVGLVAGYANIEVLWYLFVILNTLQGVFIFVVFSCSSKVRGLCCKRYRSRSQKSGSSVRTISQAI